MSTNNRSTLRIVTWFALLTAAIGVLMAILTGMRMVASHEKLVEARIECGKCCLGPSEGV